jgi:hypothetical protein
MMHTYLQGILICILVSGATILNISLHVLSLYMVYKLHIHWWKIQ